MQRIKVQGQLLRWARERSRIPLERLIRKFPALPEWEAGTRSPTWTQLEAYSRVTHAPFGCFFLEHAPDERMTVPTLRMRGGAGVMPPSAALLDTIHHCQLRQDWFREHALIEGLAPLGFVGSTPIATPPDETAALIASRMGTNRQSPADHLKPAGRLRRLIRDAEAIGVLVMVDDRVPGSRSRPLDVGEFLGFALLDDVAPLIFLNAAATVDSQLFTLAHELAHLWLSASAPSLSSRPCDSDSGSDVEGWCNEVAQALLTSVRHAGVDKATLPADDSARRRLQSAPRGLRVSERFASALVASTLAGTTLYGEAFRLLGIRTTDAFNALGRSLRFEV